ncbi:MAG: hypothetical protein NZ805_00930 [Armatimonadetes bacterium]|nr:hypothetical protein [Armatimonadota bacterium]
MRRLHNPYIDLVAPKAVVTVANGLWAFATSAVILHHLSWSLLSSDEPFSLNFGAINDKASLIYCSLTFLQPLLFSNCLIWLAK